MVKIMFSSRVIVIKMQDMALFVLSADDSKQLVTAWAKHLSATERSFWVNILTRYITPFFELLFELYLLEHFIFAFQHFQNSVLRGPHFALCFGL